MLVGHVRIPAHIGAQPHFATSPRQKKRLSLCCFGEFGVSISQDTNENLAPMAEKHVMPNPGTQLQPRLGKVSSQLSSKPRVNNIVLLTVPNSKWRLAKGKIEAPSPSKNHH